ncbi:hypothetical protein, partial [Pseudomonas fluorescens]|uniref:hypothetical protein n=1 Tax=Pseudomonas fluorescens TaxID=294 RepID=UPI001C83619E
MMFSPWVKATRATANIGVSALAVGLWRLQNPPGHAVDTDQETGKTRAYPFLRSRRLAVSLL